MGRHWLRGSREPYRMSSERWRMILPSAHQAAATPPDTARGPAEERGHAVRPAVERAPGVLETLGDLEHQVERVLARRMRLATSVRSRTPANSDSIGFEVLRW